MYVRIRPSAASSHTADCAGQSGRSCRYDRTESVLSGSFQGCISSAVLISETSSTMNSTLIIAIGLICSLIYSLGAQTAQTKILLRPATVNTLNPSCSGQTLGSVSGDVWSCFKAATSLQMGYAFPTTDSGRVSRDGATVSYDYNAATRTLIVVVESKPLWKSCGAFNERIREHVEDCRGPTVSGPVSVGNGEQWRIDGPNVRSPETAYPQIKLRPGDRVRIDADGCVQTGGPGQTWKLYVDPRGAKSPNLFHGTIRLPGMTGSQTIRQFVNSGNNYEIGKNLRGDTRIYFGYQDDAGQYANNGYWGHDDGDPVQCKGKGKAWVLVTVYHQQDRSQPL
jgi:hypothetical protein